MLHAKCLFLRVCRVFNQRKLSAMAMHQSSNQTAHNHANANTDANPFFAMEYYTNLTQTLSDARGLLLIRNTAYWPNAPKSSPWIACSYRKVVTFNGANPMVLRNHAESATFVIQQSDVARSCPATLLTEKLKLLEYSVMSLSSCAAAWPEGPVCRSLLACGCDPVRLRA